MTIADQLARFRTGTRLRLFHRSGERRMATSGWLAAADDGWVRLELDVGGELAVEIASVTCLYTPPAPRRRSLGSALAAVTGAVRALLAGC